MVSKWKLEKHKENNEKKIWEHINKVSDNKRKVGVKKQIKGQPHPKIWKTNQIFQTQHNISRRSKKKKDFIKKYGKEKPNVTETRAIEELKLFWSKIWRHMKSYNKKSKWIKKYIKKEDF